MINDTQPIIKILQLNLGEKAIENKIQEKLEIERYLRNV
jgi:hypothetical protein